MPDSGRKEMLKMLADREGYLDRLKRIRDRQKNLVDEPTNQVQQKQANLIVQSCTRRCNRHHKGFSVHVK